MPDFECGRSVEEASEQLLVAKLLLEACKEAQLFEKCLKDNSRTMPPNQQEMCLRHYTRFTVLFARVQPELIPKLHLMFHQILEIPMKGNPVYYHSYNDEHFNGTVAKIAKSCHRSCWAETIFLKTHVSETVQRKRRKAHS